MRILEKRPDGLLVIENLHDVGKKKVKRVQVALEPDLVYPLLRGRDVSRWKAEPSDYILMVQDPEKRVGYNEAWLKIKLPHTYAYLKQFEDILRERSGYKKYFDSRRDPFYSIYNVSTYTFASFKVVWKGLARGAIGTVIGEIDNKVTKKRPIIPEHNTMFVPFNKAEEAYYFCSFLNCSITSLVIQAYISWFYSTHVLDHISIPQYNSQILIHRQLSQLSQRVHELARRGEEAKTELKMVEEEIDQKAAQLWDITDEELNDIKNSLKELS